MEADGKFRIQSINRAFALLDAVADGGRDGVSLTALSSKTGLPVSTVYRILQNLLGRQYVSEDENGLYTLGVELLRLGSLARHSIDPAGAAKKHILELARVSGLTAYLAVLDRAGCDIVYIDKAEGSGNIRLKSAVGTRSCIHSTAHGKILMGACADEEIASMLKKAGMPPLTERTVTDIPAFLREVKAASIRGYALSVEENERNVTCVAAPVRDDGGHIVASVSIAGIAGVLRETDIERNAALVVEASRAVSARLGFRAAG